MRAHCVSIQSGSNLCRMKCIACEFAIIRIDLIDLKKKIKLIQLNKTKR